MRTSVATARTGGFTLVELLVVIAIIGVMVGLLLPAVQAAREAARRMSCSNNLKQIGLALHNYESTFRTFPFGFMVHSPASPDIGAYTNSSTWGTMILPFIEQQPLYDMYDTRVLAYDQAEMVGFPAAIAAVNRQVVSTPIDTFICPSVPGDGVSRIYEADYNQDGYPFTAGPMHADFPGFAPSDYTANFGLRGLYRQLAFQGAGLPVPSDTASNGPLQRGGNTLNGLPAVLSSRMSDIIDGTSNTIVIGERTGGAEMWVGRRRVTGGNIGVRGPINGGGWADILNAWHHTHGSLAQDMVTGNQGPCVINCTNLRNRGWHSFHPGGAHMLMADASVQFVTESVEPLRFAAALTRAGGESVSLSD